MARAFWARETKIDTTGQEAIFFMKPPSFRYHDPRTVEDAVSILSKLDNAKVLAGGQSLMPMLNMRFVLPDHLIDLGRITELSSITQSGETITIGAMTRQQDILQSDLIRTRLPVVAEALRHVGHRQTRNRGTIGGSLVHLDPAAELVAVAALLDAELTVQGPAGTRRVAFSEFAVSYMTTSLEPNEILTAITFPVWAGEHGSGFVEFARRHGDFAIVSAGALLSCDGQGRISRVSLAIGGATPIPLKIKEIEQSLLGAFPQDEVLKQACLPCSRIDALSDALVPASYRQHLAPILAQRALVRARDRLKSAH
jgi:aerobic carbon-monoxide dehydrogenase medium subunit